jgi:hypothetical protein
MVVVNDLPTRQQQDEMDRNAYNAAFNELGLRWYWDSGTYAGLLRHGVDAAERVRHYLETRQPHLLKAYDSAFLVTVIQQKKAEHRRRACTPEAATPGYFDWAETLGRELGA